jgi:hypothetical protein
MALVEVDVVGSQARQRRVDLLVDLRRRQSPVRIGHGKVDLRCEHVGGALVVRQNFAQQRLGRAATVDVGRVDEVDPDIEGLAHALLRLLGGDSTRVGEPRAEADLGDVDVA